MKSHLRMWTVVSSVLAALAMTVSMAAQAPQREDKRLPRYRVTDLGTLGGGFGAAQGINNRGWVVGFSNLPGNATHHSFLWAHGVKIDLGTLGGPNSGGDFGGDFRANERGQIAGVAETSVIDPRGLGCFENAFTCLPFVWEMGRKTTLPILGGYLGWAQAINNQGQVTGAAENSTLDSSCPPDLAYNQFIPVTWWNRRIHVLPLIAGDLDGAGFGMNDSGQVVGATGDCLHNFHATLWHDGRVTDLGNLGGSSGNQAFDINDGGQVVGNSRLPDGTIHGFRWQHGVMTDVGALPAFAYSFATGINDKGQVSGNSCAIDFSRCSAFIWQNGVMTDFNTLIPAGSPLVLLQARSINSRGEAAGYALHVATGEIHAFLATPCIGNRCDSGVLDTTAVERASAGAHLALPENVRHMLELALTSRRPGQAQPTHD